MAKKMIEVPKLTRDVSTGVEIRSASYDESDNSVEICWSTGARVRRYDWRSGTWYDEELVVSPNAVRTERLEAGAPFLNTHWSFSLRDIIGAVVPGSIRFEKGAALCRIRLSGAEDVQPEIARIKEGTARNVSVGYRIHRVEKTEKADGDVALWRVVDWEPYEISSVPIPADARAQVRSAAGGREAPEEMFPCEFDDGTRAAPSIVDASRAALARMRMRAAGILTIR